jgi:hypothetical protein
MAGAAMGSESRPNGRNWGPERRHRARGERPESVCLSLYLLPHGVCGQHS